MTVRTVSSKQLSMLIADEVFRGHGFVPFVGSGMSAPSGILMGQDFGNYLAYSIFCAIGRGTKHNLRQDGWPKFPRDEEVDETREWVKEKFKQLCSEYASTPDFDENKLIRSVKHNTDYDTTSHHLWSTRRPLIPLLIRSPKDETWETENLTRKFQEQFRKSIDWGVDAETGAFSRTSDRFVIESGLRSMHDWRSMLQFLAKVHLKGIRLVLSEKPAHSVIDSFNVHITRDRQINLGQKMLAHLAGPIRIRTILTTNFDNLIELAFEKLLRPLKVVTVSSKGELPEAVTVRSKDTIVKLHGELSETRADFTLDDEPELSEKETFSRYIRGEFDNSRETDPIANHILVMGFSGQDVRIIQMMKYTLDTRLGVKIFWLCHGPHEPERVYRLFGKEYQSRVIIHQTERPDLFLYELYQNITLNLPAGGFSYQFTHKVPPEKINNEKDREFLVDHRIQTGQTDIDSAGYGIPEFLSDRKLMRSKIAQDVGKRIYYNIHEAEAERSERTDRLPDKNPIAEIRTNWMPNDRGQSPRSLINMRLFFTSGSAASMRVAFHKLQAKRYHCLWLELQDYLKPEGLIQDVLRILALRVGSYQLEHVVLFPGDKVELLTHVKRLLDFLGISPGKWVLFFYGRSIPGAASGWQNQTWDAEDLKNFERFMGILCQAGFHCIYTPVTKRRVDKEKQKVRALESKVRAELLSKPYSEFDNSKNKKIIEADVARKTWEKDKSDLLHYAIHKSVEQRNNIARVQYDNIEQQFNGTESNEPNLSEANHLGIYDSLQQLLMENWIRPKPSRDYGTDLSESVDWYYKKLQFLYASTLFRQSRHTSAFFSDAVFPCPHKFNICGIDNDWVRSIEVKQWVEQLGSLDVLFYKPGGYSWKYRDMRLGLQYKLEAIPLTDVHDEIVRQMLGLNRRKKIPRGLKHPKISFTLQIRSKCHFEIASWYWKAFNATGHYLPFIEALYHYFECMANIDSARPAFNAFPSKKLDPNKDEVMGYQINLARVSMLTMIKCLKTGKPWLKFWLSGVDGHDMFKFSKLEKWFDEKVKGLTALKKIARWSNELEVTRDMLAAELTTIQSSLKSEAGNYEPKPHRGLAMPDSRFDFFARALSKEKKKFPHPLDIASSTQVWKDDFDSAFKLWLGDKWLHLRRNSSFPLAKIVKQVKKLLDNYYDQKKAKEASRQIGICRADWVKENLHRVKDHNGRDYVFGFDNSALIFLVELLSDYAYLIVKRAKMEIAAGRDDQSQILGNRKRWLQATIYCLLALKFCKHLHPAYLPRERKQQIKLHTLYGLALAHLGRPLEATRRFNEASAILSKETRTPDEVETAIIRIRRVTASLLRSELVSDILDAFPHPSTSKTKKIDCTLSALETAFIVELQGQSRRQRSKLSEVVFENVLRELAKWKRSKLDKKGAELILRSIEELLFKKRKLRYVIFDKSGDYKSKHLDVESHVRLDPILERVILSWKEESFGATIEEALSSLFTTLSRIQSAFLDEAWVYIESADRLLSGHSQSSLWCGRVAALKLRAYAQIRSDARFESLVFRQRIQHDVEIVDLQQQLLLIAPSSPYQKIKCARLGANAMAAIYRQDLVPSGYTKRSLAPLFGTLREAVSDLLSQYCTVFNESKVGEDVIFPSLLAECLDHSEETVKRVYKLIANNEIDPEKQNVNLDNVLGGKEKDHLSKSMIKYFEHCHGDDCEFEDENFDLVDDLTKRMVWFSRMEEELDPKLKKSFRLRN